jgi:hypothetical protein
VDPASHITTSVKEGATLATAVEASRKLLLPNPTATASLITAAKHAILQEYPSEKNE